jgi:hypothetical protein
LRGLSWPNRQGDGEAVYILAGLKPANLTELSKKNGGHFPDQKVFQAIDGRDDIPAHHLGGRRMPNRERNKWKRESPTPPAKPSPASESRTW